MYHPMRITFSWKGTFLCEAVGIEAHIRTTFTLSHDRWCVQPQQSHLPGWISPELETKKCTSILFFLFKYPFVCFNLMWVWARGGGVGDYYSDIGAGFQKLMILICEGLSALYKQTRTCQLLLCLFYVSHCLY